ncbi:transcription regulator HTH, apses-type DNA-binding domain-containing protein [Dissophora ornata]|nr:transcription regulator HTH, apses-type DNA-binding domain-containing protein [Dissophora ornata]
MHSGGLVGHPYGHSHDNIAALTPPPSAPVPQHDLPPLRTRLTNTIWEDEHTFCFQVDVKGVCVARRADNNMVNGTKLLNVVGMSRGKRDGILKNEKGRVVVKVGAMHLKGVWIPLDRAAHHAKAHNIEESLYPLLVDDPATFLYQHPHSTSVPGKTKIHQGCGWIAPKRKKKKSLHDDS